MTFVIWHVTCFIFLTYLRCYVETPCPPWRISCLVPSWRKRCKSSKGNTANFHILLVICRQWGIRERVHNGPEAEGDTWIRKSNVLKCVSVVGRCNCCLYETGFFTDVTPFMRSRSVDVNVRSVNIFHCVVDVATISFKNRILEP